MNKKIHYTCKGFSDMAPENTKLAFDKAVEHKFRGVKIHLRETADGEIVIIQDEKVDRTSDGEGFINKKHSQN